MAGQETPGFDFSFENGYLLKMKVLNEAVEPHHKSPLKWQSGIKKKDENLDCAGNKIFRINYHAPGYSLAAKCKDSNCLLDATKMPIIS